MARRGEVVGAKGCMDHLSTGQLIRMKADGTVEQLENRRRHERFSASGVVRLRQAGPEMGGVLCELSRSGAWIETEDSLAPGHMVILCTPGLEAALKAEVVRRIGRRDYGLEFTRTLTDTQSEAIFPAA